jgi:hypothetical protein
MNKRIRRAKKLVQVQSQLLMMERLELQTIKEAMAEAQKEEQKAIALLSEGEFDAIPARLLVRRAASAALKVKSCESLLQTQIEKTLDHARKEQVVKKRLEYEYASLFRKETELALQMAIDAYLNSSSKQD